MSFARSIAILILVAIVGVVAYQAGTAQALGPVAPAAAPATGYYPWGGFGWFFFPFGFIFWFFGIFLFFGLLRAVFGGWGRGWGDHDRYGRGSWRYDRISEIHRELHGQQPSDKQSGGPSGTGT